LEALVGNVSDFIEKSLNWWKEMMEHGWLTDIIRYMIFDLLWLGRTNKWLWGNDCGGLVMTELSSQSKVKNWFGRNFSEVIDMDGVKIDKIMVKALK
jgi:putative hemolysin